MTCWMVDWLMGVSWLRYTYLWLFLNWNEWVLVDACRYIHLTHRLRLTSLPFWVDTSLWLRHCIERTDKIGHWRVPSQQDSFWFDSDINLSVWSLNVCLCVQLQLPPTVQRHVEPLGEPLMFCVCECCGVFVSLFGPVINCQGSKQSFPEDCCDCLHHHCDPEWAGEAVIALWRMNWWIDVGGWILVVASTCP